jgi:integrase
MTTRPKAPGSRAPRERGTGSITSYPTKGGLRWRFEILAPVDPSRPEEGARKHSRGGFASYDDADVELTLLRADLIRRVAKPIGRDTFGAYAQRWVNGYGGRSGTRLYIQRAIDAMEPHIGHLQLADIKPTDFAAAYRGLENGTKQAPSAKRRRKGLATSTVARYANWVNTIFLAAQDEGLIVKNPANSKHAGRPKGATSRRVKPFSIWDVDELTRFCDWAMAKDEPWARAWVILARTGLRSGELLGLRWGDIDFNKSEMRIERALHCDETLPLGERFVIGPVKGGRPRRVTFDKTCSLLLQDWRKLLPPELAGATGNVTPLRGLRSADPVFPSLPRRAATQPALMHSFLRVQKHYRHAHPALDLPRLTVHELRHTHASLLFEAGQSVKVVQERLGHASAQVTLNTYAHLLHDAQTRAATALDDLLAGGRLGPDTSTDMGSS